MSEKLFRIVKQGKKYAVQKKYFYVGNMELGYGPDFYDVRVGIFKHEPMFLCDPKGLQNGPLKSRWRFLERDNGGQHFYGFWTELPPKTYTSKAEAQQALQRIMKESIETSETVKEDKGEWEVV